MKIKTRSQTTKHCIVFFYNNIFCCFFLRYTLLTLHLDMICVRNTFFTRQGFIIIAVHFVCYVPFRMSFWSLQQYISVCLLVCEKANERVKICCMLCCVKRCVILFYVAIKYSRSRIYSNVGYYYV